MKLHFTQKDFSLKKIVWALGEHVFACTIALIGIALFISAFLWYAYILPAQVKQAEVPESVLRFRKDMFTQVVQKWKDQERQFQQADTLAPRNIFRYNPNVLKSP